MTVNASKQCGTWASPISGSHITSDSVSLDEVRLAGDSAYWLEKRPAEQGRCVIVKYSDNKLRDMLPQAYSARSRVHEYGGGVYCAAGSGLYFVNDSDQNIYYLDDNCTPEQLTNTANTSYADLQFDARRQHLVCICQQQRGDTEPVNTLVSINTQTGEHRTLHRGHDFYASPRLSPCGSRLCWLSWNHPDMPWDSTQLWLARITPDGLVEQHLVTPQPDTPASIFQPQWSPDNLLYFASDESGWWQLYRYNNSVTEQLTSGKQEFGRPQWVFSQSVYAFISADKILCAPIENGAGRLCILDINDRSLNDTGLAWSSVESVQSAHNTSWFIAASANSFPAVTRLDHAKREHRSVRSSCSTGIDRRYFSHGQHIQFNSRHNDTVHAIYYPPHNPDFSALASDKPPLIVLSHGGPTAMADTSLDLRKQFWTSRGFAIVDVNYSGSTGFGREYRQRLDGNWGIRDVEDCCDAALHLVEQGLADAERLIIRGSSAGGYTVLCALAFHNVFTAGACYYGIGNLESLLDDTHKFESRYTDRLVGPYPEFRSRYEERSPLNFASQIDCPVIFFQGAEDRVVPREQTEQMYNALKDKGIAVACIIFPGELHGFRQADTIQKAINAEFSFYTRVLQLGAEPVTALHIDNLAD